MQTRNAFSWLKKQITRSISVSLMIYILTRTSISSAYPIFAQQGYENPREATGRIVCANCHLANKPVEIEVPQAVLPDTVFEAVVSNGHLLLYKSRPKRRGPKTLTFSYKYQGLEQVLG